MNEECFISYLFNIQDLINDSIIDIHDFSMVDVDSYLNKTINGKLDIYLIKSSVGKSSTDERKVTVSLHSFPG